MPKDNTNLGQANKNKNDEFYTQFDDIQKEINCYLDYDPNTFQDKVVYCNCDDPYESNFFKFFALNFKYFGLKKLISTSYKSSCIINTQLNIFSDIDIKNETAYRFIINDANFNGNQDAPLPVIANMLKENKNNEWIQLKGDGDFRSKECIELLKQSDIVVTNPPFSLFREYVAQLMEYRKKFIIIGNPNAISYREFFPLLKDNKIWLGNKPMGIDMLFDVTSDYAKELLETKKEGSGYKIIDGVVKGRSSAIWFTNLLHNKRNENLRLMSMDDNKKYNKSFKTKEYTYKTYDNYNAIEVPKVELIPNDYEGIMGVPISFMDKYNPNQFEIIGIDRVLVYDLTGKVSRFRLNKKEIYARIIIKHKNVEK